MEEIITNFISAYNDWAKKAQCACNSLLCNYNNMKLQKKGQV
jgi:hypothetical protein